MITDQIFDVQTTHTFMSSSIRSSYLAYRYGKFLNRSFIYAIILPASIHPMERPPRNLRIAQLGGVICVTSGETFAECINNFIFSE